MKKKGNISWLWSYYKRYQIKFYILVAVSMGLTLLLTKNPELIGRFVDEVIVNGDKSNVTLLLCGMVGITLISSIGKYIYLLIFQSTAQDVIFYIRHDLYEKIQNMDQEYIKDNRTGTLMSRMIGDTGIIVNFLSFSLQEIIVNIILAVAVMIMMYTVNPIFFFSFLIPIPFLFLVGYNHSKKVRPGFIKIREQYAKLNTVVQENVSGNRVVRAFMNGEYEFNKFDKLNTGFMDANLESVKVWSRFVPIIDGTGMMMSAILIIVGGLLYIQDAIKLSDIVQMASYLVLLDRPLRSFGWTINKVEQLMASTGKIRELMSIESKLIHQEGMKAQVNGNLKGSTNFDNQPKSSMEVENPIEGDIVFDHVSFKYDQEKVIQDFNLHIKKGKTIALIGATGSGKSTIIDLIGRFYEVHSGEIRIDGKPINEYNLRFLRSQMAMSLQNVFLFSDTIENNIRYGYSGANEEEIIKVADVSGVHEFVEKMPAGYGTVIGENGVGLSGGQKQRIALARALIKNPAILILDDTTSSVDMETEYQIHQGLKGMKGHRTTILVAHRISSIKHADEIIVMDQGRIIERGNHRQLIQNKKYYYQVLKNQMGDFDLELVSKMVEEGVNL